jgi:uncharacterized protein (TIGR00369 family)
MTESITFDRLIGMEYVDVEEDGALRSQIVIQPHHCNPTGFINGGVFLSIADNLSTGMAGSAYLDKFGERAFMVGIDVHASMLSNQKGGTIVAESRVVRVGKRVTVIRTLVTGEEDKLLADVTTTHVPAG